MSDTPNAPKISDLEPSGTDEWERPLFRDKRNGIFYCTVDFDMTLEDVAAGRTKLYYKGEDSEGEPNFPIKTPQP